EDARSHPLKNIITRALGMEPTVEVDVKWEKAKSGDVYLLCSDGLTDLIPDAEIVEKLTGSGSKLGDVANALIQAANAAGGTDNITVGLCRVE
ncbi:MAG: SpoIIE family protein phosphatase, partial [Planctomycetes bacterium]|nr:SpoIIE family protein phosphatase [Planctomycetota bacterium]